MGAYESSGRTYFRWCNSITRGAMAKMTSNAAGFQDPTSGRNPSFADVPSGSTFFDYVERLVMHGAIAEWPPKSLPGACGSSTLSCFYTGYSTLRADAIVHVFWPATPTTWASILQPRVAEQILRSRACTYRLVCQTPARLME
jgi:hypothetical protein